VIILILRYGFAYNEVTGKKRPPIGGLLRKDVLLQKTYYQQSIQKKKDGCSYDYLQRF
jgi:hypothetical protein